MSNEQQQGGMVSYSELLAMSKALPVSPKRGVVPGNSISKSHLSDVEKLSSLKLTTIPPTPKKSDQEAIKGLLKTARIRGLVVPIGAVPRDALDTRATSIKQKKLASFSTNEMTFSNFSKDGDFFNICKQFDPSLFSDTEVSQFVDALKDSLNVIGSSGSMTGLLTRLNLGLTEVPKVNLDVGKCVEWASRVLAYKDIEFDYIGKSLAEVLDDVHTELKFNLNSSAGVPYYCKIKDALASATQVGTQILNAIADGTFGELAAEKRPAIMATLLKNKQDYYEVSRLDDKIRPYFVFPFHERLLYSSLQVNLKAKRFDESEDSGSAVGFSWNYGGGDRMYDWIIRQTKKGTGFYPCFYGDDQLWVIVSPWGSVYIVTPDFSHMDLSLTSQWGLVAYRIWRKSFKNLDKTWEAVLKLNCRRAFTRQVIIDGALAFYFKYGLASGIPGTTKFDEVASAAVNGWVKERYENDMSKLHEPKDLAAWLVDIKKNVKDIFGLLFKEGTLTPYFFKENQESYDFVFLGQTLVRVYGAERTHYIPKPQLGKLVISATTYKKAYGSTLIKQKASMQKYRSLYAGGGFLYRILANRFSEMYEIMEKRSIRPLQVEDDEFTSETESSVFVDIDFEQGDVSFPTSEWCLNLYLPPDDSVLEHAGITMGERLESETASEVGKVETSEYDDFTEFDFVENFKEVLHPKGWGEQAALERVLFEDKGADKVSDPKGVPVEHMGQVQPLSEATKKKFAEDQAEQRAIMRERKIAMTGTTTVKKGSSKRSGKSTMRSGAGILEGDNDLDLYEDEESGQYSEDGYDDEGMY
jgi:hypothetical protein